MYRGSRAKTGILGDVSNCAPSTAESAILAFPPFGLPQGDFPKSNFVLIIVAVALVLALVITIAAIFYTADPHLNGFRLLPRAPKKN